MKTEKDHVSTADGMEENGKAWEKISAAQLAVEVEAGLKDLFEATITRKDVTLLFAFPNGQCFRLTLTEEK